jgi:hypothetical protein
LNDELPSLNSCLNRIILHEPVSLEHQNVSLCKVLKFLRLCASISAYPRLHLLISLHGPVNLLIHVQEDVKTIECRCIERVLTKGDLKIALVFLFVTAVPQEARAYDPSISIAF